MTKAFYHAYFMAPYKVSGIRAATMCGQAKVALKYIAGIGTESAVVTCEECKRRLRDRIEEYQRLLDQSRKSPGGKQVLEFQRHVRYMKDMLG